MAEAKEHLATYLIALCKYFYDQRSKGDLLPGSTYTGEPVEEQKDGEKKMVWQCKCCLTIYDEELGETDNGITAGTLFDDLKSSYTCPLCDAPVSDFQPVKKVCFMRSMFDLVTI